MPSACLSNLTRFAQNLNAVPSVESPVVGQQLAGLERLVVAEGQLAGKTRDHRPNFNERDLWKRSLLGMLESLRPGGAAARGRRDQAAELERRWRQETAAHTLATVQGYQALRRGFAKLD